MYSHQSWTNQIKLILIRMEVWLENRLTNIFEKASQDLNRQDELWEELCWIFNKHRVSYWGNICKKAQGFPGQYYYICLSDYFETWDLFKPRNAKMIMKVHKCLQNKAKGWLLQCTRKTKTAEWEVAISNFKEKN